MAHRFFMAFLKIKQLKGGMVLAEDLTTSDGRKLLSEGCVISEVVINKLERLGIPEVNVSSAGLDGVNHGARFQTREELSRYVNRKFFGFEESEFTEQLKELSRKYLNEQTPVRK